MNIFVLSVDPVLAAMYQCDKHVVKMALETAQMLSTIAGGPYKPTHAKHPCTIWAGTTWHNFEWLREHGMALCREYSYRYNKRHKCQSIIENVSTPKLPSGLTPFAQAMPDEYRDDDAVAAYRRYYHSKTFAKWTRRNVPSWWRGACA